MIRQALYSALCLYCFSRIASSATGLRLGVSYDIPLIIQYSHISFNIHPMKSVCMPRHRINFPNLLQHYQLARTLSLSDNFIVTGETWTWCWLYFRLWTIGVLTFKVLAGGTLYVLTHMNVLSEYVPCSYFDLGTQKCNFSSLGKKQYYRLSSHTQQRGRALVILLVSIATHSVLVPFYSSSCFISTTGLRNTMTDIKNQNKRLRALCFTVCFTSVY